MVNFVQLSMRESICSMLIHFAYAKGRQYTEMDEMLL